MELREELGRSKPQTIDHLMEIANRWADGEDSVKNHIHSDEEAELERRRDRRGKRRMRVYDDRDDVNMVAAGYADRRDDNRNSGYRDSGKTTQVWQRVAPRKNTTRKSRCFCALHHHDRMLISSCHIAFEHRHVIMHLFV